MKRVILCFVAFLLSGPMMQAQLPTGTILGVVKDPSGAVVPGAKITAVNTDTGQSRTVTTEADGAYPAGCDGGGQLFELPWKRPGFRRRCRAD